MKVFSLLSLGEIWEISRIRDKQLRSSPCMVIMLIQSIIHTGVEYCLFDTGFPEPLPDKRNAPHFFVVTIHFGAECWEYMICVRKTKSLPLPI